MGTTGASMPILHNPAPFPSIIVIREPGKADRAQCAYP